jgi:hypothetical protein
MIFLMLYCKVHVAAGQRLQAEVYTRNLYENGKKNIAIIALGSNKGESP